MNIRGDVGDHKTWGGKVHCSQTSSCSNHTEASRPITASWSCLCRAVEFGPYGCHWQVPCLAMPCLVVSACRACVPFLLSVPVCRACEVCVHAVHTCRACFPYLLSKAVCVVVLCSTPACHTCMPCLLSVPCVLYLCAVPACCSCLPSLRAAHVCRARVPVWMCTWCHVL